jgi:effector-binding domain-containing protein
MKILKTIGLVLAGLLFLIVLISVFLPGSCTVKRSIVINKKAMVPFGIVKDFKSWDKWSPWDELDPNMQKTFSETSGEVGSWYQWDSKNPDVGKGKITILKLIDNELIEDELAFEGMGTSLATYTFEPTGESVKVTWALTGNSSELPWYMIVPYKYFSLLSDKFIGPDFEKGLNKLKTLSESMPDIETIAGYAIEERQITGMNLSGIRSKMKTSDMSSARFAKWFAQLSQELSQQNIQPAGAPMTIYHEYTPTEVDIEAAIPVLSLGKNEGPVVFREMPPIQALVVKYYGDYSKVENVYIAAYTYLKEKGKSSTGAPMEIYITDPGIEKDTAKWLTEIVFPLDQ